MSLAVQYRTFSQRKPRTTRVLLVVFVIVILLGLIRASLPSVIAIAATSWFESQDVEVKIDNIDIFLFGGLFSVNGITGNNKAGQGFSLDHFSVSWQWLPLYDSLAIIDRIEIRSLHADAILFGNGDMNIAGLEIKSTEEAVQTDKKDVPGATPWDVTIRNIVISDAEICVQKFIEADKPVIDYCGTVTAFNWEGGMSYKPSVKANNPGVLPLYAQGALTMRDIALRNNQFSLNLLDIGSVDLRDINIDTPENIYIDNLGITKISVVQRENKTSTDDAQIFYFDSLGVKSITLSKLNNLKLGVINIVDASAFMFVEKSGSMEFKKWLPGYLEDRVEEKSESLQTKSEPFYFSFDEFVFISKKKFVFFDDSLKEPVTIYIHDADFKITQLDSHSPDTPSYTTLSLGIDKHGSFKLEADVTPLAVQPGINGKGKITGFDLRTVAPLIRQQLGHNIKSGQLDVDLKINVDQGAIDSNIGLVLHHLELKTLDKKEAKELNSEFGFPLSSSLSLLRDKDNTIRLNIPVKGDINNPEFDPKDAIVNASSKAITAAVFHFYTPFGLVFATESLFDLATALSFEPIIFDPGETELNDEHTDQLDKIVALMAERPGIHLTLCGMSNNMDRSKLLPALAKTTVLSPENISVLKKLAEDRSANLKNYLVKIKSVEASRLIECSPEYIQDEISGVVISI